MACTHSLAMLSGGLTGAGYVHKITGIPATINLFAGDAANFPAINGSTHFYATIHTKCADYLVKVINNSVATNTFNVIWVDIPPTTLCIGEGSRITYSLHNAYAVQELIEATNINVSSPLTWDCATRTIGIDCGALKQMVNGPCA